MNDLFVLSVRIVKQLSRDVVNMAEQLTCCVVHTTEQLIDHVCPLNWSTMVIGARHERLETLEMHCVRSAKEGVLGEQRWLLA